jgi:hypothetical protein
MKDNITSLIAIMFVVALFIGASMTYVMFPRVIEVEKIKTVDKEILVQMPYNDTAIRNDVLAVKSEILKDNDWEAEAKALATSDMEEKSYRNVYNALVALNVSIRDKEDVNSVVIKDTEFSGMDVDEKDATVIQELKVYYEDSTGSDKKAYLTLETEIVDNEVDDTKYTFT